MHQAVDLENSLEAVKWVLKNNLVSVDAINIMGGTPLSRACHLINPDVVDLLLENGADPNIPDVFGESPLHKAIFYYQGINKNACDDRIKIVSSLLNYGAKVDHKNNQGRSPMSFVSAPNFFQDEIEIMKLLQKHGADINSIDNKDISVLVYAALAGNVNIVQYLLQQGAGLLYSRADIEHINVHNNPACRNLINQVKEFRQLISDIAMQDIEIPIDGSKGLPLDIKRFILEFLDPDSSFKVQYEWVRSKLCQFLAKHVDLPVENGYRALTEEEKDAILSTMNSKTLELFKYIETIEKNSGKIIFGPEEAITLELLIKKCQEIKEAIEAPHRESKEEENLTKELKDTADEGDIFDAKDLISQAIDHSVAILNNGANFLKNAIFLEDLPKITQTNTPQIEYLASKTQNTGYKFSSSSVFQASYYSGKLFVSPFFHMYNDYISNNNHDKSIESYFFDNLGARNIVGAASFSVVYNALPQGLSIANKVFLSKIISDGASGYYDYFSRKYIESIGKTIANSFVSIFLEATEPDLYRNHPIEFGLIAALFGDIVESTLYTCDYLFGDR